MRGRVVIGVLVALAIVVAATVAVNDILSSPSRRQPQATAIYASRSFQFALGWSRTLLAGHVEQPSKDTEVNIPGVGIVDGSVLQMYVVYKVPESLPADERGEVVLTALDPAVMPAGLEALDPSLTRPLGSQAVTRLQMTVLGGAGLRALLFSRSNDRLATRDYIAVNQGLIYWFRLEASASRWNAVEPSLDAVAQTLAVGDDLSAPWSSASSR